VQGGHCSFGSGVAGEISWRHVGEDRRDSHDCAASGGGNDAGQKSSERVEVSVYVGAKRLVDRRFAQWLSSRRTQL
jgi:hypothetical protein